MQDDWVPFGEAATPARMLTDTQRNTSKTATAREFGAVAANANKTARELADHLPAAVRSATHWKFSSSVIASSANKSFWPKEHDEVQKDLSSAFTTVISASGRILAGNISSATAIARIAVPADSFLSFAEDMARQEAKLKDLHFFGQLKEVKLLPPVAQNVSFYELVDALSKNAAIMNTIEMLELSGASAAGASDAGDLDALTTFLSTAKNLKAITISNCDARSVVAQVVAAAKEGVVESLSLDSNNLGLATGEAEAAEEIRASLAELLRNSKFLLSLNLAHNNFSSEAMASFMQALFDSDTKLTPDDVAEQRARRNEVEEPEPVPVAELVDRGIFFGDSDEDEEMEDPEDEPSLEEEEEEEEEGAELEEDDGPDADHETDTEADEGDDEEANQGTEEGEEEEEESPAVGEVDENDETATDAAESSDEEPKPDLKELRRIARALRELRRGEKAARIGIQESFVTEVASVAQELTAVRARFAEEKRKKMAEYCERRSGWSHLQKLTLRGNAVGDRGARGLAKVLRSTVALNEDEITNAKGQLRNKLSELVSELTARRRETRVDESGAWAVLASAAARERKALQRAARINSTEVTIVSPLTGGRQRQDDEADEENNEEEDEYLNSAPPIVMTNVETYDEENDGDEGSAENDQENDAGDGAEESVDWEGVVATMPLSVSSSKAGMNSITFLDLGSCGIVSRGLEALADSLSENSTLTTLILRNNPIATGKAKNGGAITATGTATVAGGFLRFTKMLEKNSTLSTVDLGYCGLDPPSLRALSASLSHNSGLTSLNLEGNAFRSLNDSCDGKPLPSALLALLSSVAAKTSALKRINLSHNAIGDGLWADELNALAAASSSSRLTHLYLSNSGLRAGHLGRWAAALHELQPGQTVKSSLETLHLARNNLGGEEAGQCLGSLLALCDSLRELNVDENPLLLSTGLAAALNSISPACTTMQWLSCNAVGLSTPSVVAVTLADRTDGNICGEAEEQFVIPPHVMAGLSYLALGDLDIADEPDAPSAIDALTNQIQTQAHQLRYLSLWSRRLPMEEYLQPLKCIVDELPSLQYVDYGVLLRFDMEPDLKDCLGEIESTVVARRVATVQ